ncbi:MAG: hypothetical protein ACHQF3_07375 [Alphaproteobacteria bacterium]
MVSHPLSGEYPLILIEWVDSSRVGQGWVDLNAIGDPDPHKCVSVGFLLKENAVGKILVPTIADVGHPDNRHSHGGIMIPSCSIISERRLEYADLATVSSAP